MKTRGPRHPTVAGIGRRALLLLACVGLGSGVGWAGHALTGSQAWWLALPAFVIVAWLWVAHPSECTPPVDRPDRAPGNRHVP